MNKILVLFAHPVYQTSLLNKSLVAKLQELPQVTFHDLYESYPNFMIDVKHEQELLLQHDAIIFQHPIYWYSSPSILKEWMDLVLEHGFAYGSGATALKGKYFMSAVTSGGDEDNYEGERNIRGLLKPFEYTAKLCEMSFLPPFVTYGGLKIKAGNFDDLITSDYLNDQVVRYTKLLDDLSQNRINADSCKTYDTMNELFISTESEYD